MILVGTFVGGCRCVTSWCDLDLTFDLVILTMNFKLLSGLLNSVHWLGGEGVHHFVTFSFGSAKVCSPAILETAFSYDKYIWIAATDYLSISIDISSPVNKFYIIIIFSLLINAVILLLNCLVLTLYLCIYFLSLRHLFFLLKHYLDIYITDTALKVS